MEIFNFQFLFKLSRLLQNLPVYPINHWYIHKKYLISIAIEFIVFQSKVFYSQQFPVKHRTFLKNHKKFYIYIIRIEKRVFFFFMDEMVPEISRKLQLKFLECGGNFWSVVEISKFNCKLQEILQRKFDLIWFWSS